ncbi:hypothetical protein K469DRAFT_600744 [Zopfia rhizophila CBS 207.26]|uniref:SPX domain-containing protein n=1 Tax=Zopfia rhizophila CBS 207.26 TaxID=1314779 RepID=A0A6A6DF75_9PEZI|nr:hypothetical protein K469DRAFT_600744 [Zopfia rhizophila CBS 207.26]
MKYGDTLQQRSIPEWDHFNIDYDYLKDLIKHYTTPSVGKAVSIPGRGETTERAFGETFCRVLTAQHDRINLFIRCKSGEIERRLEYISNQLLQLQARHPAEALGARLPARTVEKYAKIDADVTKAGEEIRSLSRFRVAQRTGFSKILKKYKRWTDDPELEHRFKEEVVGNHDSFFHLDLGYLLDQYIDVLSAVRAPFDNSRASSPSIETANSLFASINGDSNQPSSASGLFNAKEVGTEIDFDTALSTIPLGSRGSKATYWIHSDHIVEVEIHLLQYMRPYGSSKGRSTRNSTYATPGRQRLSTTLNTYFGNEDDTGLIVLDHPEAFAKKQNVSMVGSNEEPTGALRGKATGNARWTSSGEAVVVVGLESNQDSTNAESIHVAKLKRKHLEAFLDTSMSFMDNRRNSASSKNEEQSENSRQGNVLDVREWLVEHEDTKPITGICAKRTRFVGLHNGPLGGLWATLDRDIFLKKSLNKDLVNDEWLIQAREDSHGFPHAVLEVRREGGYPTQLIQALDRSHLVERVRGFSLETHAVWICCKPSAMSTPHWIPLLDNDIRKLPASVKRQRRKAGSVADSLSNSRPHTSASSKSVAEGQTSPNSLRIVESSATSGPESFHAPSLQSFRKKTRKPYADYTPSVQAEEPSVTQGYWNEYDNPESEDEGYYIYIDPNASVKFPGQEIIENWARKTKKLFRVGKIPEESPLLSTAEYGTSDGDETADESVTRGPTNYGAIASGPRTSRQRHDYFSSIFRLLRNPYRNGQTLNTMRQRSERERQDLLDEIHIRQHEREMTKLRLYSTCLVAAVVIDTILGTLTATSRRKKRGVVDGAIFFGTISNLLILSVAVTSMKTRQERLGWFHQGVVFAVAIGVVVMDVLLLHWVLSP